MFVPPNLSHLKSKHHKNQNVGPLSATEQKGVMVLKGGTYQVALKNKL